jgi:hypothetical protein
MLTRLAFFEGAIRLGCEGQFEDYVKTKLLPIWRQTPRAVRVDVLRRDRGGRRRLSFPDGAGDCVFGSKRIG